MSSTNSSYLSADKLLSINPVSIGLVIALIVITLVVLGLTGVWDPTGLLTLSLFSTENEADIKANSNAQLPMN